MAEDIYREIVEKLHLLTERELRQMNKELVARIRSKMRIESQKKMSEFYVGQWVRFDARGRRWYGTIRSLNTKSVSIDTPNQGVRGWKVDPQFLTSMTAKEIEQARQMGTSQPTSRSKVAVG